MTLWELDSLWGSLSTNADFQCGNLFFTSYITSLLLEQVFSGSLKLGSKATAKIFLLLMHIFFFIMRDKSTVLQKMGAEI